VAMMVFLEVSLGEYEAALAAVAPLLAAFTPTPEIASAPFVPDAAEALIQVGRLDEADALISTLESNGRRLDRPWALATGGRCRSMLLAARGDLEAALTNAERAMVEHRRLPMPFERARTQLLLGQLQRRRRHRDVASGALTEALQVFERLATPLWAARARADLARVNGGLAAVDGLTPGERRVAELAASGMTNRSVAAALFISPKTVETNLARVYRKLDIRSRAELGQRMGQPGT
jgi:DNA-binding CsgD family transcriptional regulator